MNELNKKLFEIQKEGLKVKKDADNPFFKSKYTTLDGLLETLLPICEEKGLLIVHRGTNWDRWETIVTDVESGEEITSAFPLPREVDPQKMGSAITYAKRYNLVSIFNIASDNDDDGNSASGDLDF